MTWLDYYPHDNPVPVRLVYDSPLHLYQEIHHAEDVPIHMTIFQTEPHGHIAVIHHGADPSKFGPSDRVSVWWQLTQRWSFPIILIEHYQAAGDIPEQWMITAYDHVGIAAPIPLEAMGDWWSEHRDMLALHSPQCPDGALETVLAVHAGRRSTGRSLGDAIAELVTDVPAVLAPRPPFLENIIAFSMTVDPPSSAGSQDPLIQAAAADWLEHTAERLLDHETDPASVLSDASGIERFRIGHGLPGSVFLRIYATAWFAVGRVADPYRIMNGGPVSAEHLAREQNRGGTIFLLLQAAHLLRKPTT